MNLTQSNQPIANEAINFDCLLSEYQDQIDAKVASIGQIQACAIVKHINRDAWMMILEDVSGGGRWRTQSFDHKGFSGHMIFGSKQDAIEHAVQMEYTSRDDGALDRIQDTHAFRAGMFAVEQIQLLNSGKIDMQTYTARIKAFHAEAEVS